MGRKSRENRGQRAQRTTARRALRHLLTTADSSQPIAYCAACGRITMGMQASGLYEVLTWPSKIDRVQMCSHGHKIRVYLVETKIQTHKYDRIAPHQLSEHNLFLLMSRTTVGIMTLF